MTQRHARRFASCLGGILAVSGWTPAAGQEALVAFRSLAPEAALEIAQAALASCRDEGYQIAVAVVDRAGVPQVLIRDRYAGPHTADTATRKAFTAVSFRADTLALAAETAVGSGQSGVRDIDGVLMLGGGVPVVVSGSIVAGVGVSGGPSGEADHACAEAGIGAIIDRLELAAGD